MYWKAQRSIWPMEMARLAKPYYERQMEWLHLPDATMNSRNTCWDLAAPPNQGASLPSSDFGFLVISWFICFRRWCIDKLGVFHANINIYVSWSTSELRVRLAPLNQFKPSSKIFYWPFQGGTSFVDLLCFCSFLCLLCLCALMFICALWSPAGKGLTSRLSFVVTAVSLSLSHCYPGSGVVLDCIDSWSLHPYLLLYFESEFERGFLCSRVKKIIS